MKPEECRKLDTCDKIRMVMDKELGEDRQYTQIIRRVCERCGEGERWRAEENREQELSEGSRASYYT